MKSPLISMMILFLISTVLSGCGPSKDDWEAKLQEIDDLKGELASLKEEYENRVAELQAENDNMKSKLEELDQSRISLEDLIEQLKKKQEAAKKRIEMFQDMLAKFKSLIEAGKLKVKIRDGKMLLELPSAVLFKPGQAHLSKNGKDTLVEVAPVLASIEDREFQVAGHTDNVPIKVSQFASNWELSTARAVNVVKYLQENGVPPESLSVAGYSEFQPIEDNSTQKGKKANRRIEIVVMPNLDELPDLKELEEMID